MSTKIKIREMSLEDKVPIIDIFNIISNIVSQYIRKIKKVKISFARRGYYCIRNNYDMIKLNYISNLLLLIKA